MFNENPSCRFWDMALGIFAAAFEKRSLPLYTRVRWRGMVRCGAFATKARKSMVVETSFAGALVRKCTDRVRRTGLRARRCCAVVACLYPDLRISRTVSQTSIFIQSLQRPHERRPMASRREQVSALFFVAWTRRLTECFPRATEGPNPPKETLTFKKEFFWQTTPGLLPAGLKSKISHGWGFGFHFEFLSLFFFLKDFYLAEIDR